MVWELQPIKEEEEQFTLEPVQESPSIYDSLVETAANALKVYPVLDFAFSFARGIPGMAGQAVAFTAGALMPDAEGQEGGLPATEPVDTSFTGRYRKGKQTAREFGEWYAPSQEPYTEAGKQVTEAVTGSIAWTSNKVADLATDALLTNVDDPEQARMTLEQKRADLNPDMATAVEVFHDVVSLGIEFGIYGKAIKSIHDVTGTYKSLYQAKNKQAERYGDFLTGGDDILFKTKAELIEGFKEAYRAQDADRMGQIRGLMDDLYFVPGQIKESHFYPLVRVEDAKSWFPELKKEEIVSDTPETMALDKQEFTDAISKMEPVNGVEIFIPFKDEVSISASKLLLEENADVVGSMSDIFSEFNNALKSSGGEEAKFIISALPTGETATLGFRPPPHVADVFAINPFALEKALMDSPEIRAAIETQGKDPNTILGASLVDLLIHEYVHKNKKGHETDYSQEYNKIFSLLFDNFDKIGGKAIETFRNYRDRIRNIGEGLSEIGTKGDQLSFLGKIKPESGTVQGKGVGLGKEGTSNIERSGAETQGAVENEVEFSRKVIKGTDNKKEIVRSAKEKEAAVAEDAKSMQFKTPEERLAYIKEKVKKIKEQDGSGLFTDEDLITNAEELTKALNEELKARKQEIKDTGEKATRTVTLVSVREKAQKSGGTVTPNIAGGSVVTFIHKDKTGSELQFNTLLELDDYLGGKKAGKSPDKAYYEAKKKTEEAAPELVKTKAEINKELDDKAPLSFKELSALVRRRYGLNAAEAAKETRVTLDTAKLEGLKSFTEKSFNEYLDKLEGLPEETFIEEKVVSAEKQVKKKKAKPAEKPATGPIKIEELPDEAIGVAEAMEGVEPPKPPKTPEVSTSTKFEEPNKRPEYTNVKIDWAQPIEKGESVPQLVDGSIVYGERAKTEFARMAVTRAYDVGSQGRVGVSGFFAPLRSAVQKIEARTNIPWWNKFMLIQEGIRNEHIISVPYLKRLSDAQKGMNRVQAERIYSLLETKGIDEIGWTYNQAMRFIKSSEKTRDKLGWLTEKEFNAGKEVAKVLRESGLAFGIPFEKMLKDYAPRIRNSEAGFAEAMKLWQQPELFKWWAEEQRTGYLMPHEKNIFKVARAYVSRGARKSALGPVLEDWARTLNKAVEMRTLQRPEQAVLEKVLSDARGYPALFDSAMDVTAEAMVRTINKAIDKVTFGHAPKRYENPRFVRQGTQENPRWVQEGMDPGYLEVNDAMTRLVNLHLNLTYAGALGLRPIAIIRNLSQSVITISPIVGPKSFAYGVGKAMTPEGMREAKAQGVLLDDYLPLAGEIEKDMQNLAQGISQKTLWAYTKVDNVNRAIAYHAMKHKVLNGGDKYLRSLSGAETPGQIAAANKRFMDDTDITYFHPTLIKNEVLPFLKVKDINGLAERMGKHLADETQWVYRRANSPVLMKGRVGKLLGQFGTWPAWYIDYMRNIATRGSKANIAKRLAMWGVVNTGMVELGEKLFGVDTSKWVWFHPLNWAGGLAVSGITTARDLAFGDEYERGKAENNLKNIGGMYIPGWLAIQGVVKATEETNTEDQIKRALGFMPAE